MTEEAKKNLLDYMLGKMPSESGVDEPQFSDNIPIANTFIQALNDEFSNGYTIIDYISGINNDNYILYGIYVDDEYNNYGFLTIIDSSFNLLSLLTKYDSGTLLRPFECLGIDEEGMLYGVDYAPTGNAFEHRFIMLNNVLTSNLVSNDYYVQLRQSYYFPDEYQSQAFSNYMYYGQKNQILYKKPNSSEYCFILTGDASKGENGEMVLVLKLNVGQENEWISYVSSEYLEKLGSYVVWTDDEFTVKLCGYINDGFYCEMLLQNEIFNIVKKTNSNFIVSIVVPNLNVSYFSTQGTPEAIDNIYKSNSSSNDISLIYSSVRDKIYLNNRIFLTIYNGTIFSFQGIYTNADTDIVYDLYAGIILNDKYYQKRIVQGLTLSNYRIEVNPFVIINNIYNLYNLTWLSTPNLTRTTLVYNQNNYNGEPFTDKNSLNSNSAILYSDNNPVFARNLYNKTQNGATTTSTIEIPNNYLNDTLVDQKDLMSVNNNVIISDTNGFTKNVYETVYLNFVNTISVVNQNETQSVYNNAAATKLNTSINNPTDYDDLKLTKYRINYQDGTNTVSTLQATSQNDGSYELLMTFYLSKLADTLELVSEDEQTVYLSYNLANVEANKYYSFKQRVRIGGN